MMMMMSNAYVNGHYGNKKKKKKVKEKEKKEEKPKMTFLTVQR